MRMILLPVSVNFLFLFYADLHRPDRRFTRLYDLILGKGVGFLNDSDCTPISTGWFSLHGFRALSCLLSDSEEAWSLV